MSSSILQSAAWAEFQRSLGKKVFESTGDGYSFLAIHEKTDSVAGLTEVVVPAQHPTRADQYDTIVVPDHRGYGIDRALKARMLFELRSAEPDLLEVQTWNAPDNEAMLKVNAELGFEPDREWLEYEAEVVDLVQRFAIV